MKTISVIIPNHNYARFLAETLESVLTQTYPAVQVIFIDDGSTDDSVAIASAYPITVLAQDNQGVSAARNNAATYATGDYLLFLDSDDLLYPDSLAVMAEALSAADEHIGYVYGQLQYFGEKSGVFESGCFDAQRLARGNYIQTSVLIRRDVFEAVGGFDRGLTLREDWELFVRCWHHGKSGLHLPRPVIMYRKHRPKQVVRGMSKRRKRLSDVQLAWLYPQFFWRKWLSSPLRLLYYYVIAFRQDTVRQWGQTGGVRVIRRQDGSRLAT